MIVEFVDAHKKDFGVEPICVQLGELGCSFTPSTYYEARGRKPSLRAVCEEWLKALIVVEYEENYQCYGARKMWLQLRQGDVDVARCTVERLMTSLGLRVARRGKVKRTTVADPAAVRAKDLVGRKFAPLAPNRLWVADFTYVSTLAGWVYVAFVIDAYARRILGWKVSTSMTTDLVISAIDQAIFTRKREGVKSLAGLVHHNDAGSQYTAVRFNDRLREEDIDPSIGVVGDAHDNSLAESINALYKTELIKPRRPWRNAEHVSAETASYVDWFNNRRLYDFCGDMPPAKLEQIYRPRGPTRHTNRTQQRRELDANQPNLPRTCFRGTGMTLILTWIKSLHQSRGETPVTVDGLLDLPDNQLTAPSRENTAST